MLMLYFTSMVRWKAFRPSVYRYSTYKTGANGKKNTKKMFTLQEDNYFAVKLSSTNLGCHSPLLPGDMNPYGDNRKGHMSQNEVGDIISFNSA